LAITAHFAQRLERQDHTKLSQTLLAFKPIDGCHNASCLSTAILDTAEEFGIQNHIQAITSDNASDNSATFKLLEESDRMKGFRVIDCTVSCMAHVLNLSAQQIL
ncbi:hypothetical protein K440DRAFT_472610, partial [Wilcoxina mikolae CBS 423.85]